MTPNRAGRRQRLRLFLSGQHGCICSVGFLEENTQRRAVCARNEHGRHVYGIVRLICFVARHDNQLAIGVICRELHVWFNSVSGAACVIRIRQQYGRTSAARASKDEQAQIKYCMLSYDSFLDSSGTLASLVDKAYNTRSYSSNYLPITLLCKADSRRVSALQDLAMSHNHPSIVS